MQSQWILQDAKNKFNEVVNAAYSGTQQFVSKRGQPSVVILSVMAYRCLLRQLENGTPSFSSLLLAMLQTDDEPKFEETLSLDRHCRLL